METFEAVKKEDFDRMQELYEMERSWRINSIRHADYYCDKLTIIGIAAIPATLFFAWWVL